MKQEEIDQALAIEVVARFSHKTHGRNGQWNTLIKQTFIDGALWAFKLASTPKVEGWISVKDQLPPFNETVWLYFEKSNHVCLGEAFEFKDDDDRWTCCWAEGNGVVYSKGNKILSEAEYEDLAPSHWHHIPSLPTLSDLTSENPQP